MDVERDFHSKIKEFELLEKVNVSRGKIRVVLATIPFFVLFSVNILKMDLKK
jgi:hypothetical protein